MRLPKEFVYNWLVFICPYFLKLTDREHYLEQMIEQKNARILELKRRIMSTNSPSEKASAKREALQLLRQKKLFVLLVS